MNDRERAANQDLQVLGDAYRLGQIPREEYRARRRHVLAGLRGGDTVTARKPLIAASADTVRNRTRPAQPMSSRAATTDERPADQKSGGTMKLVLLLGVGLLIAAALVWFGLLKVPDEASGRAGLPAASSESPAGSGALAALEADTDRFIDANNWQPSAVDGWLQRWQTSDATVRSAALARPALQRLRDQVSYNLSVRRALLTGEAGSDDRPEAVEAAALARLEQALAVAATP